MVGLRVSTAGLLGSAHQRASLTSMPQRYEGAASATAALGVRRIRERPGLRQSLRRLFRDLRAARVPARVVQACVDDLEISPVLTAHPTEGKRRTTMNHLLRP